LLNQTALKSAKAAKDALGQSVIEITFTEVGAKQFAEITRENLNKRLAIIIYGQVCQAPIIRTEVTGGKAQISGAFSNKEAKMLARKIAESLRRD
jgi:preprotein translocase subunit SecD